MFRQTIRPALALALAMGLMTTAFAKADKKKVAEDFGKLSVAEVDQKSKDKTTHVYDANSAKVYAEGHVPGAVLVDITNLPADKMPTDKASTLIFYCKNTKCTASHDAARAAKKLGYSNVHIMPDGIDGWIKAGKPVVKGNTPT